MSQNRSQTHEVITSTWRIVSAEGTVDAAPASAVWLVESRAGGEPRGALLHVDQATHALVFAAGEERWKGRNDGGTPISLALETVEPEAPVAAVEERSTSSSARLRAPVGATDPREPHRLRQRRLTFVQGTSGRGDTGMWVAEEEDP